MKSRLEKSQNAHFETFKTFVDTKVAPHATSWEAECRMPLDIINEMARTGLLGAPLSSEFGGNELDQVSWGLLNCEIGRASSSLRTLLTVHTGLVGLTLQRWGTEQQRKHWLPQLASGSTLAAFALSEEESGSDAAAMQCSYRAERDGYLISGKKTWISFGSLASLYLIFARGENGISAFLLPRATSGLTVNPLPTMLALRASHMATLDLHECWLPGNSLVGQLGVGFSIVANTALDHGRYSVAWGGVGLARACLEASAQYVGRRQQFGKQLSEFQLIRKLIADMALDVRAAESLCLEAGRSRERKDFSATMNTNIAKQFVARVANDAARAAVQVHGALGMTGDGPVERHFRDAKVLEIIEGSTEIQTLMLSDYVNADPVSFLYE